MRNIVLFFTPLPGALPEKVPDEMISRLSDTLPIAFINEMRKAAGEIAKLEQRERTKSYHSAIDEHNAKLSGKLHYTCAAVDAVNDVHSVDLVVGLSDRRSRESQKTLDRELANYTRKWIVYNGESSEEIITAVDKEITFEADDNITLITNSGVRSNVLFFSTFVQILGARGVTTRLIYVDNKDNIIDVTSNNRYYDILRGVELFSETGDPHKLLACYPDEKKLEKLKKWMTSFYQNMQIAGSIDKNSRIVDVYSKVLAEIDYLVDDESTDALLRLLLPVIKTHLMPLGESVEPFFQLLQWCNDNGHFLTGYFILDAELTSYLGTGENAVILFQGNKLISRDRMLDNNRSYMTDTEKGESRNSYTGGEITAEDLRIIYRTVVRKASRQEYDNRKAVTFQNGRLSLDANVLCSIFEDVGVERYATQSNDTEKVKICRELNKKLFKLMALHELIRRVRNNLAHYEALRIMESDHYISLFAVSENIDKLATDSGYQTIYTNFNERSAREISRYMGKNIELKGDKTYTIAATIFEFSIKLLRDFVDELRDANKRAANNEHIG